MSVSTLRRRVRSTHARPTPPEGVHPPSADHVWWPDGRYSMGGTFVLLDSEGNVIHSTGGKVRLEPTQPEPTEPPRPPVEPPPPEPEDPGPPEEPEPQPTPQPAPVPVSPPPVVVVEPTPAPEPPSPTEPPPSTTTRHSVPTWLRGVDLKVVSLWVVVIIFHCFTYRSTSLALGDVLGWPAYGWALGAGVELGTFVLLAGAMTQHAQHRALRVGILTGFSLLKVYAAALLYLHEIAGEGSERDLGVQAFAELQVEVFAPLEAASFEANAAAEAAESKCTDESGVQRGGYGRRARALCDAARDLRGEATLAQARVDNLAELFDGTDDLDALGLYERAVEVSRVAGVAPPQRSDYYRSPLFAPVDGLVEGRPEAIVAVALALFIDLSALALGLGLHHHSGPDLPTRVVGVRLWWRRLRAAWSGPLP